MSTRTVIGAKVNSTSKRTERLVVPVSDDGEPSDYATFEYLDSLGMGDGLPVIAPTPARVEAMVASVGLAPEHVVARLAPNEAEATVELIAVNAIMAGCGPQHFPAVLAMIDAVSDPKYDLLGQNTTTNPAAPLVIINGPMRHDLKVNAGWGVLGPYFRSNAVLGRALSLCLINIAGRIPGQFSRGTYKVPGAFTMCAGEDEENSPWEPLHVSRGFEASQNVVTVVGVSGASNMLDPNSREGEELARCLSNMMAVQVGSNWLRTPIGPTVIMLCPQHAAVLAERFPTRLELQEYFNDNVRVPFGLITPGREVKMRHSGFYSSDAKGVKVHERPDQWLFFVAGGAGGLHSCHLHTYGAAYAISRAVP